VVLAVNVGLPVGFFGAAGIILPFKESLSDGALAAAWVSMGLAIIGGSVWLGIWFSRKLRRSAKDALASKIDQLLAAFPQECQTWGGRAALADTEIVKEMLRELDAPHPAPTAGPVGLDSLALPVYRELETPHPALTAGTAEVVPPPAQPQFTPSPAPSLPPALESERSRQIRFVAGLRHLLARHEIVGQWGAAYWPVNLAVILGLPAGFFGGFGIVARFEASGLLVAVWVSIGLAILGGSVWLGIWFSRKLRRSAKDALASKIDQLLTAFPQECQTWGGRAALADAEIVKGILRELDTPQR
jgi:hypothetical protein